MLPRKEGNSRRQLARLESACHTIRAQVLCFPVPYAKSAISAAMEEV